MTDRPNNPAEIRVDVDKTSPNPGNDEVLSTSATVAAALHYAEEHRWAVFPCRHREKRPATQDGFKSATIDSERIERLFEPSYNVAVVTGDTSGVFVLDVDGEEGEASLASLEVTHGALPETVTATTPSGGRHFYFRTPEGEDVRNSASKVADKIDVRGEGGYVVAPPSELLKGAYRWANGKSPDQLDVAEAPEWLLKLIGGRKSEPVVVEDGEVPEGERNSTLTSLAGSMRYKGLSHKAIEAALLAENGVICKPPLPDAEVKAIAKSIARYEPTEVGSRVEAFKPFPAEALPGPLCGFVVNASEAIGCDPCYIALPLLTALASAIGNTRRIQLKEGWAEPAILWSAIVGDSGTMKSPALEAALRPVKERQKEEWRRQEFARHDYESEKLQHEKQLANWKKSKSDAPPPIPPDEPLAQRTWADDLTVEALAMLLQQNPRGLLVACDELASWLGGFDRYSQGGGDAARWLEMFGGRSMSVDRKTGDRKTIYVPRASVCVTGGIQPGVLQRALKPEHRESGLAARLLLANPPRKPKVWTEEEIDPEKEAAVAFVFERLYAIRGRYEEADEIVPLDLPLSDEAKAAWITFYGEHAEEQAAVTGDLAAAWSKLEGGTARLALVIHMADAVAREQLVDTPISGQAMRAAIRLIGWFKHEIRRCYAVLNESESQRKERLLVDKIRANGGTITPREMQRTSRDWPTAESATEDLDRLVDAKKGEWRIESPSDGGGRPGRVFWLHVDVDRT